MAQYECVLGRAGTGKSWLLKERARTERGSALCATTGIAAVNLGAGTTINSLLWYYNTDSLLDAWTTGKLDYRLGEIYGKLGIRRIFLDELSMLPASNLSVICLALNRLNNKLEKEHKPTIGLTLAGDYFQLMPIEGEYAFESEHWDKFEANTTVLQHIYRQEDKGFTEALNLVRAGKGTEAVDFFKPYMNNTVDAHFDGTTVFPYNKQVDAQNAYRLGLLKTKTVDFINTRIGKCSPEWKLIPEVLNLKQDALVMILNNQRDADGRIECANGDLGYLRDFVIEPQLDSCIAFIELVRNKETVAIEYVKRTNEQPVAGKKTVVGSINYLPIRLAYASTVHKVQGLSLDRIQLDFRSTFFRKSFGMLYVGLSRARTTKGLRLIGGKKTFVANCTSNPKLQRWL